MSAKRVAIQLMALLAVVVVIVALARLSAPKAYANQSFHNNHILISQGGGPFTLPAYDPVTNPSGYCAGFDVLGTPVPSPNQAFFTQTTLPDGTIVQTIRGASLVDLTNQATGKTVRANFSGPATVTLPPDGSSDFEGHGITPVVLTHPEQVRFGLPGLAAIEGSVSIVVAPDGSLVSVTYQARFTDECAALA